MDSFFVKEAEGLSDGELVWHIRSGEYEYLQTLINRYMPYIKSVASRFNQFESEDIIQEGRMAIFSATKVFDGEKASFSTFVKLCINRAVGDYVKAFSVKKRIPQKLITSIEDLELSIDENPEKLVIDKESYDLLSKKLKERLSDLEYKVLREFLAGASYVESAQKLKISQKSYDNALKRIRNKLKSL